MNQEILTVRKTAIKLGLATLVATGAGAVDSHASDLDSSPPISGDHSLFLGEIPNALTSLEHSLFNYQEQEIVPTVTAVPNSMNINIRTEPSPTSEIVGSPSSEGIRDFTLYGFISPEQTGDGHTWYYTRVNGVNSFVQDGVVTINTSETIPTLPNLSEAFRIASEMNVLDTNGIIIEESTGAEYIRLEILNGFINQIRESGFPEETLNEGVLSVFDTGIENNWYVFRQEQQIENNEPGSVFTVLVNETNERNGTIDTMFLPQVQTALDLEQLGLPSDVDFRPTRNEGVLRINSTVQINIENLLNGTPFEESLILQEERESTGITIRPGEVDLSSLVETHPDAPNYSIWGAIGFSGQFADNSVLEQISNTIAPDMFDNPAPLTLSGGTEINETQLGSAIGYVNFMGSPYAVVACVVYNESISEPDSVQNQYHSFLPLFCKAENNAVNVYVKQVFGTPNPGASDQQWFMAANLTDEGYQLLQQSTADNPLNFADMTDMIFRISFNQGEALIMDRLENAVERYNGSIVLMMLELGGDNVTGIVTTRALAEGTLMPGANEAGFIPRIRTDDNAILLGNLSQDYLNERGYIVTGQPY